MAQGRENRIYQIANTLLICCLLVSSTNLIAQNLVPNGSFEQYKDCPHSYTELGETFDIEEWYSPTRGTPDYFNKCSKFNVNVPNNFMGYMYAKTGNAYVGLLLAEKPERVTNGSKAYNEREYLLNMLSEPLKSGNQYEIKLYYSIAPHSTYAVNSLGVSISNKRPKGNRVISAFPQVEIDTATKCFTKAIWIELCDTIVARGGEKYITIGNFRDDYGMKYFLLSDTDIRRSVREDMAINRYAYYWIDEVSVKLVE